jgi:hypothetical protein
MVRRSHADHRDVRTEVRAEVSADHRAPRDHDRYVGTEIALSIATQCRPFFVSPAVGYRTGHASQGGGFGFEQHNRDAYYASTHLQTIQFALAQRIVDALADPADGSEQQSGHPRRWTGSPRPAD